MSISAIEYAHRVRPRRMPLTTRDPGRACSYCCAFSLAIELLLFSLVLLLQKPPPPPPHASWMLDVRLRPPPSPVWSWSMRWSTSFCESEPIRSLSSFNCVALSDTSSFLSSHLPPQPLLLPTPAHLLMDASRAVLFSLLMAGRGRDGDCAKVRWWRCRRPSSCSAYRRCYPP